MQKMRSVEDNVLPLPVLFFDGECNFCNGTVKVILAHERAHDLRFASLQGTHARTLMLRYPFLQGIDSLVWVSSSDKDNINIYTRSSAALRAASYIGGPWKVFNVFYLLPKFLRDLGYDLFARYRYRIFGQATECLLPTKDQRARFLD